jgi:hypothetical protein
LGIVIFSICSAIGFVVGVLGNGIPKGVRGGSVLRVGDVAGGKIRLEG